MDCLQLRSRRIWRHLYAWPLHVRDGELHDVRCTAEIRAYAIRGLAFEELVRAPRAFFVGTVHLVAVYGHGSF